MMMVEVMMVVMMIVMMIRLVVMVVAPMLDSSYHHRDGPVGSREFN